MSVEFAAPPPETSSASVRWLSDGEQEVWRQLLAVEARLHDRLDRELRDAHGVTLGEYAVLVHLSEAGPGGLRMSDLADRLGLSRSGLTRRIDGLVRAGMVTRHSCPNDGRGSMAQLTGTGAERLAEAAPTHVSGVRRYLIDVLGGDLAGLAEGLRRVEEALEPR